MKAIRVATGFQMRASARQQSQQAPRWDSPFQGPCPWSQQNPGPQRAGRQKGCSPPVGHQFPRWTNVVLLLGDSHIENTSGEWGNVTSSWCGFGMTGDDPQSPEALGGGWVGPSGLGLGRIFRRGSLVPCGAGRGCWGRGVCHANEAVLLPAETSV